jgi:hypothetical protein
VRYEIPKFSKYMAVQKQFKLAPFLNYSWLMAVLNGLGLAPILALLYREY